MKIKNPATIIMEQILGCMLARSDTPATTKQLYETTQDWMSDFFNIQISMKECKEAISFLEMQGLITKHSVKPIYWKLTDLAFARSCLTDYRDQKYKDEVIASYKRRMKRFDKEMNSKYR